MPLDAIAEIATIEASRLQREALAFLVADKENVHDESDPLQMGCTACAAFNFVCRHD